MGRKDDPFFGLNKYEKEQLRNKILLERLASIEDKMDKILDRLPKKRAATKKEIK